MPILNVHNLTSIFRTASGDIRAVDNVDLQIDAGEVVCLVGESGCGKSAFANSVMGLMPLGKDAHPSGSIQFGEHELLTLPQKSWQQVRGREIGMIFQEPMTSLNPVMRIGKQVAEPLLIHNLADKQQARAQVISALADVGIPQPSSIVDRYPHELSGGMRQRVMIAMATIAKPRLLIADEPTTALDVTIEAQILQLLKHMQEKSGMAMLFITHDLGVVAQIADRVCVMYAGQVVEQGTVEDVFQQPSHPYTAGLLASKPRRGARQKRMRTIAGIVPPPLQRPSGCRFEPRCQYAEPACIQPIALGNVPNGSSQTRCLFPEKIQGGAKP